MANPTEKGGLLKTSLLYLHVKELQDFCKKLQCTSDGKKIDLVFRLIALYGTGKKTTLKDYPPQSIRSKRHPPALSMTSLILKGTDKNDLKTRLFFKEHIGSYFHFTAFGIDWIQERWLEGSPPLRIKNL